MASPLPWEERGRSPTRHSRFGDGAVRGNDVIITPSLILSHQGGGKFFRELDAPQLCCGVLHSLLEVGSDQIIDRHIIVGEDHWGKLSQAAL